MILAALVVSVAGAAFAQDKMAKKPAAPKQTKCVVTGEELGSMGKPTLVSYTGKNAAYKGKKVAICCGGCEAKVKADPDKYFKTVFGGKKKPAGAKG
jgi:hypothetical protein